MHQLLKYSRKLSRHKLSPAKFLTQRNKQKYISEEATIASQCYSVFCYPLQIWNHSYSDGEPCFPYEISHSFQWKYINSNRFEYIFSIVIIGKYPRSPCANPHALEWYSWNRFLNYQVPAGHVSIRIQVKVPLVNWKETQLIISHWWTSLTLENQFYCFWCLLMLHIVCF